MRIAVIGLGLIGGSTLLALAQAGHEVVGYDANVTAREAAAAAASITRGTPRWRVAHTATDAVTHADLVLLAVPLPAVHAVCDLLADIGYSGIVSDMTSVKEPVHRIAGQRLAAAGATFIGGHPMAGKETSGFVAADPTLFTGCPWVLCLEPETPMPAWLALAEIVLGLGARVVPATAAEHDAAVAIVSHVPHLVATAIAATAGHNPLALALAAGSFRDGTRVAATNPDLVAAMCGGNAAAVLEALDAVTRHLAEARTILAGPDPVTDLPAWVAPGQLTRTGWQTEQVDQSPPPAVLPVDRDQLLALGRLGGWVTSVDVSGQTVMGVRPDRA